MIAAQNDEGRIKGEVVIEQPVAKKHYKELCAIQKLASTFERPDLKIIIMADESLWDLADLRKLQGAGGVGAINIKMQKCGGLLAGLDIAKAAVAFDANTRIYLGAMIGTSDLSSWALISLARALPRCDYFTAGPRSNMETHIASTPIRYLRDTNELTPQRGLGIGTEIDLPKLARFADPELCDVAKVLPEVAGGEPQPEQGSIAS